MTATAASVFVGCCLDSPNPLLFVLFPFTGGAGGEAPCWRAILRGGVLEYPMSRPVLRGDGMGRVHAL